MNRRLIILIFLFFLVWLGLTLRYKTLPFYGDQIALISHPANLFYDNNFTNLIIPDDYNTGHPPLLPVFFAVVWKIFGKSLEVSHWAMFVVVITLFYSFVTLCNRFIAVKKHWIPFLLFSAHPVIITQTLGMSTDIFLVLFFLMGINAVLSKRTVFFLICCMLLLLSSLRGIIYVAVLGLLYFFVEKDYSPKNIFKTVFVLLIAALPFISWNIFHNVHTGWCIVNPESPWREHRQVVSGVGLAQNVFIYFFRLAETGFVFIWLFIFYFSIVKKVKDPPALTRILVLLIFFTAILFIPYQNPILKRYMLGIECIGLVLLSTLILSARKQSALIIFLCLVFVSSHFYIYPEKMSKSIGYNWDATLAVTPYFELREDAIQFLENIQADGKSISAGFPMYQSFYDTNLKKQYTLPLVKLNNETGNAYDFFIYSNIMNGVSLEVLYQIQSEWKLIWEKQKGNITMQIYQNPEPVKQGASSLKTLSSQKSF